MSESSLTTGSAAETRALACRIAQTLRPGSILALAGDLGAGKTTFVQGLAEGLEVSDLSQVLSPTYTLVNEYPAAGPPLVHIDFYRLAGAPAATALGLEEQIHRCDAVVAIEWADLIPELIPEQALWVRLILQEGDTRSIMGDIPD